jgi:hypothetical protein
LKIIIINDSTEAGKLIALYLALQRSGETYCSVFGIIAAAVRNKPQAVGKEEAA